MKTIVGKKKFLILLFLFLLTFLPRLTFVLFHPEADFSPDIKAYHLVTSKSLLEGEGFRSSTGGPLHFTAPLYSVYLAFGKLLLGDSYRAICCSVFLLDVLTCFTLYSIARRIFDNNVALFAAAAFALYPPLIKLSGGCNVGVLLLFLISVGTYFLVRAIQEKKVGYSFFCGIFMGLAALAKPVTLLFPLFLAPWFLVLDRKEIKNGIKNSIAVLIAMVLIISPWIIRQYIFFHKFIPITNQGKVMLQNKADFIFHSERLTKYDRKLADQRYRRSTSQAVGIFLGTIAENPLGYLKSALISVPHLYFRLSSRRFIPGLFLAQAVVLGFSLVGIFRYFIIERRKRALPLIIVLTYFLLFHSTLAGATARYGLQTIPILLMFAGYEVLHIIRGKEAGEP